MTLDVRSFDRRSFLQGAVAATAAAMLPASLLGCAKEDADASQTKDFEPMSEEARAAAIADPSYMGGKTNFYGQPVEVGMGAHGQVASQRMIDKHKDYEKPTLVKVTDRIYCSAGNALANSTMIIGDTGIIIVDTSESVETAQLDLDQFRTVTDKPVVAVIYTHNHYTNGTAAFIEPGNPGNVPIIAQSRFMEALMAPLSTMGALYGTRGGTMLGVYLPLEGDDGSVGCGAGAFYRNPHLEKHTPGFIAPNTLVPADEHMMEMTIDGVALHFYPTTSDSVDNINIHVVDENTIITNQAWGIFFNMYTLRGETYRDPSILIKALDDLIALNADNLVSVHGLPMVGRETVSRELVLYRDSVQFVFDQTVRFMNKGYDPNQIVEAVTIPTFLVEGLYTKPIYGEVEHFIRGIYRGLIGWFANDPIELHPVSKAFESGKIVEAMGGPNAVLAEAKRVLEDKQYSWAATLATYVLNCNEENEEAKILKAQACRKMGQVTDATNTRHWYMSKALELEGKLEVSIDSFMSKTKLMAAPYTLITDMIRVTIDPEKALGVDTSFVITYPDKNASCTLAVRNCVAQALDHASEDAAIEVKIPFETVLDVVLGNRTFAECIKAGEAELIGDMDEFAAILDVFEMDL